MSYGVWVEPGYACPANYTSNLAGAWRAAGIDLAACDGRRAAHVAEGLAGAIETMEADPEAFRQYEPWNGWGDVEGAIRFLRSILRMCQENPTSTLVVSR